MIARRIDFLSMVMEITVLRYFLQDEMFQPRYHWVETNIWVPYKTDVCNFLANLIKLFFNIRRQLPRADLN